MDVAAQIEAYLAALPEAKQGDLRRLHALMLTDFPRCRLWFSDGTDDTGKVVTNPNIGYGEYTIHYTDGSSKLCYRVGLSATTSGVSVYVLGLDDKTYLKNTYGASIGKAKVTGYCIAFRHLADVDLDVLQSAVTHRMTQ